MHPSFTAWLRCSPPPPSTGGPRRSVASKLHSLATLQAHQRGRTGGGPPRCIQASQLGYVAGAPSAARKCARRASCIQASQLGYVAGALDFDRLTGIGGCIQASQLGYVAGRFWRPTAWSAFPSCIQASQLGYVAGGRCGERLQGRAGRCIQASQLGYVAGSSSTPRTGATRTVASKLHSLATLQEVRARGGRLRGGRCIQASQLGYVAGFAGGYGVWGVSPGCIQASQLGYVAGPRRPCTTSWSGPLHPSFTAWLRCRCPSMAMVMARSAQLHPSFTAWLRCRQVMGMS